jgi:hypothetical protein
MDNFDYKKHSLEQVKTWVRDALVSAEVSPQEIYDTIKGVVNEEYHYFKHHTGRCYDLLALLNGNGKGHIQGWDAWEKTYYPEEVKDDGMRPWGHSDLEYLVANQKKDKVKKWVLPVEECKDADTDKTEYFVSFPEDLLEAADLKEGDRVEWVDNGDETWMIRKVTK